MTLYNYQKYDIDISPFTREEIKKAYDFICEQFVKKYKMAVLAKPFVYQPLLECAYTLVNAFHFLNWSSFVNAHINGDIRVTINALHGDKVSTLNDIKKEYSTVYVLVGTWSFLDEGQEPPTFFKEFINVLCDYYKQVFTAVFKELEKEQQEE